MTTAFEYTLKVGGLEREEDYPYTGTDRGSCKFDKSKIAASVSNFSVITLDEEQIAANLVKNGPLAGNWPLLFWAKSHLFYRLNSCQLNRHSVNRKINFC